MKWLLLLLAACSSPPTKPRPVPPTAPIRTGGTIEAAGVYWVPYVTCDECERPQALVAHMTTSPAKARALVASLANQLPLGFPYVIHTDEINTDSARGIAVVVGNYKSVDDAKAARKGGQRVLELGGDPYSPVVDNPHVVVTIDRGAPVRAFAKADVDRLIERLEGDVKETDFAGLKAMCTVKPGDVFLARQDELHWYTLAPVRCNGMPAFVPWTKTLLGHAVVVPDGEGHKLYQVVGAQCDSPIIESWSYGSNGREAPNEDDPTLAGC